MLEEHMTPPEPAPAEAAATHAPSALWGAYRTVRARTEALAASLSAEDQLLQSMPDASPAKWHRAHTTWFFETFVLAPHAPGYRCFDAAFAYLFNSYYVAAGPRHPRPSRGLLSRPSCADITAYRAHVDAAMQAFLPQAPAALESLITLGLHHEQQHQELLCTDILHGFAQHPAGPAHLPGWTEPAPAPAPGWLEHPGGLAQIGHAGEGFAFDNETPRHTLYLQPFRIARALVRNAEYLRFIEAGGYQTAQYWMSEGFERAQAEAWEAPLYWRRRTQGAGCESWEQFGPSGWQALSPDAPVRQISWYEADAYARWAGARLPLEAELELAGPDLADFTGHVWQWSASAYAPYPGFTPAAGAVGEYNGKFMINQMVLRGASLATPAGHARPSYRNFFHPEKRWQFTGLRLAACPSTKA